MQKLSCYFALMGADTGFYLCQVSHLDLAVAGAVQKGSAPNNNKNADNDHA